MNHLDRHFFERHTDDGERENRLAAHRIHIRERVGRGDAAEVVGIIDDGREEIGGSDDRLLVVQPVYGSVVARFDPHQQILRQPADRGLGEDLGEYSRRDLAAAAAPVGELRQADEIGGGVHG